MSQCEWHQVFRRELSESTDAAGGFPELCAAIEAATISSDQCRDWVPAV